MTCVENQVEWMKDGEFCSGEELQGESRGAALVDASDDAALPKDQDGTVEHAISRCKTCHGRGSIVALVPDTRIHDCPDCIQKGICPKCGQGTILNGAWACSACGFPA